MIFLARLLLGALLLWGGWAGYIQYQRWDATQQLVTQLKEETKKEADRRIHVIDAARKNAERQADAIAAHNAQIAATLREIDTHVPEARRPSCPAPAAAARPRNDAFLDARSVRLLDDIRRRPGGATAERPARR